MLKKSLLLLPLVAALSAVSLPSRAADYHVIVPAPGKAAPYAGIKLELSPATLPVGLVGDPFAAFDLTTALRITGDPELDMSQVAWSVYSGSLLDGLSLAKDGRLVGTPTEPGSASFQALAKYKTKTALGTFQIAVSKEKHLVNTAGVRSWEDGTNAQSCLEYRQPTNPYSYAGATGDGLYRIAPNGQAPFDAYCDMSSEGGGWTRVALQYEKSPVAWTGQVNGTSYSLTQNQIPPHSYTAFGKDDVATYVDYVPFHYMTGELPLTLGESPKTGKSYQIYRSTGSYYRSHDPEQTFYADTPIGPDNEDWANTLTFDEVGKRNAYTWAFSPQVLEIEYRGYSMANVFLKSTQDNFGWSVWVR